MTAGQDSRLSPTASQAMADPYGVPRVQDFFDWHDGFRSETDSDYVLPAPDPAQRLTMAPCPQDRRRLDLHAALTAAGIAPLPGDLAAIEALCTLDDTINAAVRRWITGAA